MAKRTKVANAGKDTRKVHGSEKKTDLHLFDPAKLTLVEDTNADLYDKRVHEAPKEKFILNIMALGVHTPIKVWKNPETGETEVVFGRKRTLALREANRRLCARGDEPKLIPATILHSKPAGAIGMMISENEHREEDTTSNRAEKAARMVDRGASLEDVGNAFGLEVLQVKNLLAFNGAPAYVRKAVEDEKVTLGNGIKAAKLAEKDGPEAGRKLIEKLIAEAPRTPGKKRSPNSRKAREIVEGAPVMRSKKEIAAKAASVMELGDPKDLCVRGMVAALAWVLGGEEFDFARVQLEVVTAAKMASG
jgi:ParB family transcriptional regulator, chromosome partitioning protein